MVFRENPRKREKESFDSFKSGADDEGELKRICIVPHGDDNALPDAVASSHKSFNVRVDLGEPVPSWLQEFTESAV
jgi:hypothetical protein